jgi:peptidoglycan-N-acetylglucosamine deacetylase
MKNKVLVVFVCAVFIMAAMHAGCSQNPGKAQDAGTNPASAVAPGKAPKVANPQQKLDQYWSNAKEEVDKGVIELMAQDQVELQRGLRFSKFMRGDTKKKWIALTFDDGPHPAYTPKLLDILKQYNAKATFFVVGEMAEKSPDLVKAEIAAGHSVGNHTYHHVNLTKIPKEDVAVEIKACGDVIKGITGVAPHLFRPPGGDYNKQVAMVSEAEGYKMILWTDDPADYASPGDKVIRVRLLDRVSNGGIILIHDGVQETVDVLPKILQTLKDKGFELVTIDEMMGGK